MRTVLVNFGMAALVILINATAALSCTCIGTGPPCQEYGKTAVVFVGTPIEMKRATAKPAADQKPQFLPRLFVFTVEESFRGLNGAQVEIQTGFGGGDCGYAFNLGTRYLVYAAIDEKNGTYVTSTCMRTRPVSEAAEDFDYIRGLSKREPGATLSGEVRRYRSNLETGRTQQLGPLPNIKITVEGEGRSYVTQTDAEGRYQLTKLPPGKYQVKADLPAELSGYVEQATALDDRGCSATTFYVTDNGRIRGRVIDADGKPVPGIMVNLILASQANSSGPQGVPAYANGEGYYELRLVPPGNYLLGIRLKGLDGPESVATAYPRVYYPGVGTPAEAAVLTIGEGTLLKDIDLRLSPRLTRRVISGSVKYADGTPAAKANVVYYDRSSPVMTLGNAVGADDQGNFSFEGREGTPYCVMALFNANGKQWLAPPVDVAARGEVGKLLLVVSEPNNNCESCARCIFGPKGPPRP